MSDRHVRLLRAVAKRRQQDAEAHPNGRTDTDTDTAANDRGRDLRRVAALARARLEAARARRDPAGD